MIYRAESFDVKQMGARNAGNPHVACDVEGAGDVVWVGSPRATPARQPSTLLNRRAIRASARLAAMIEPESTNLKSTRHYPNVKKSR